MDTERPPDLHWVVDRARILDLTARYNRAYDNGDPDTFASLFTADAVMEIQGGPSFVGRDALRGMCPDGPAAIRHVTVDAVITVDGDRATQDVTLLVVGRPSGERRGSKVQSSGRYVDDLVRTGGGWRFARRQVAMDGGL